MNNNVHCQRPLWPGVYWESETQPALKEKALIEWGIMRQTRRQMLACLYNGSARSFTRIPATPKAKFEREFGSQPHLGCVPPAAAIVWLGKGRISMTKVESVAWFYGTWRDATLSGRLRRSVPVWCRKVVLAPKMQMFFARWLVHYAIWAYRPSFLKVKNDIRNMLYVSKLHLPHKLAFNLNICFTIALFASLNRLCQMRDFFFLSFLSQTVSKCISLHASVFTYRTSFRLCDFSCNTAGIPEPPKFSKDFDVFVQAMWLEQR